VRLAGLARTRPGDGGKYHPLKRHQVKGLADVVEGAPRHEGARPLFVFVAGDDNDRDAWVVPPHELEDLAWRSA
jgi:hypothetical protein